MLGLTKTEKLTAILWGTAGAILITLFANAVETSLDRPDVHISNSTGECVRVLNYVEDHKFTCEDLPSKYNNVWVK